MLNVFIDGGARNNPGPAAVAFVIYDKNNAIIKEFNKDVGEKTNNEAEYLALIETLRHLKKYKDEEIVIHTDSSLLWGHLNNKFKIKEESLFPYFIKAHNYTISFKNLKIELIERERNRRADALVKNIISASSLKI